MAEPKKKLSDIVRDMAGLKAAWASTAPAPDTDKPLPPGDYVCELVNGEPFAARTGTPGFKVTLRVVEGPYKGRLAWHDFYLSPAALPYTLRALGRIGVSDLEQLDAGLPPGLVVKAKLTINKRDDGTERNELRTWELVQAGPPAEAPAATPAPSEGAPSPSATSPAAPWAVDLNTLEEGEPKGDAGPNFDFGAEAQGGGQ
jgi:hypothetical protein